MKKEKGDVVRNKAKDVVRNKAKIVCALRKLSSLHHRVNLAGHPKPTEVSIDLPCREIELHGNVVN